MKKTVFVLYIMITVILSVSGMAYAVNYYDPKSGAILELPNEWKLVPLNEEREYIDVKYVSSSGNSYLMYGSYNLWDNLTDVEKSKIVRSELNTNNLTENDVAEWVGDFYVDCNIRKETLDSRVYFVLENKNPIVFNGNDTNYSLIYAFYMENGNAYTYQLYSYGDEFKWNDLKSILRDVDYSSEPSYINADINAERDRLGKRVIAAIVFAAISLGIHSFLSWNCFWHDAESAVRQLFDAPQLFRRTTELRDCSQFLISRSSQCAVSSSNGNLKVWCAEVSTCIFNGCDGPVLVGTEHIVATTHTDDAFWPRADDIAQLLVGNSCQGFGEVHVPEPLTLLRNPYEVDNQFQGIASSL